jgi:multicomponent Na+:H+ antiporter subunit A
MTQFLVEILLVVIALSVIQAVPARTTADGRRPRRRDAALALGLGTTVSLVLLAALQLPFDDTVPRYFLTESVPGGFGRNVVNVILVDFRALDTLGEIAVLAVAALGAFALLRFGPSGAACPGGAADPSLVLRTAARLLLALLLVTSLFMLWRGHNEPGGGFIGGLFAASAVVLDLLAFRRAATERLLRVAPRLGLPVGLAVAVGSGLVGVVLAGAPFLTGQWTTVGGVKLGTPLLFDVGVFLVVVGFTLTIILALERATVDDPGDAPPAPPRSPDGAARASDTASRVPGGAAPSPAEPARSS